MAKFELKNDFKAQLNKIKNTDSPIRSAVNKASDTGVEEIPLHQLHEFKNHPYHVIDDAAMNELVDSIKKNGVINPGIARKNGDGYEIIEGHRRKRASELAGQDTMPFRIVDISDIEAVIRMVDSNIYRSNILSSEKAFAYKMRLEAMKSQGKISGRSDELLAAESNDSARTIQRYIRLTYLNKSLLNLVDTEKLPFVSGVELSYLSEINQNTLFCVLDSKDKYKVTYEQAKAIRLLQDELEAPTKLSSYQVENIVFPRKEKQEDKFALKEKDVDGFFPADFFPSQKQECVLKALQFYLDNKVGETLDEKWNEV